MKTSVVRDKMREIRVRYLYKGISWIDLHSIMVIYSYMISMAKKAFKRKLKGGDKRLKREREVRVETRTISVSDI